MRRIIISLGLIFTTTVFAQEDVTLSGGNDYTYRLSTGHVTFTCPMGQTATHYCIQNKVLPEARSHIYYNGQGRATKVELTAHHVSQQTQKTITRTLKRRKQRSRNKFTAYWPMLGDIPLFREGLNDVDYKVTRRGKLLSEGSFQVSLTKETRSCAWGHIETESIHPCSSGEDAKEYACNLYFEQATDCQ